MLSFTLPSFSRTLWVNDSARQVWEERFLRVSKSWSEIEWRTVADQVRSCALVWLSQQELASLAQRVREYGLRAIPLLARLRKSARQDRPLTEERKLIYRVVIGTPRSLRDFRKAWIRGDDESVGRYLGYPECCRSFFRKVFVDGGWIDHTWPCAIATANPSEEPNTLDVSGFSGLNLFWSSLGVRLIPHFPCRYDCAEANNFAQSFIATGKRNHYLAEVTDALEILQWPIEWSALHGIAEIKTPILKISSRTDATSTKCTVRYSGNQYPKEGANGLVFPYRLASIYRSRDNEPAKPS